VSAGKGSARDNFAVCMVAAGSTSARVRGCVHILLCSGNFNSFSFLNAIYRRESKSPLPLNGTMLVVAPKKNFLV
jgi:hypothetical protein